MAASIDCFPVNFEKSFRTVSFCRTPCDCHVFTNLAETTVECWLVKIAFPKLLTQSWTNTSDFIESEFEHGCFPFDI